MMALKVMDKVFYSKLSYKVLTLNVKDAGDNPPVISRTFYLAEVKENSPPNVVFATVRATDADSGANAAIRFVFNPTRYEIY